MPDDAPAPASLGKLPAVVAVALIMVFLGFLLLLLLMRGDRYWDRMVFLLAGLEAIVFAGAGALFGTTIQRANVDVARRDATNARTEAQVQQERARDAEQDATAGRMLAVAVETKAELSQGPTARLGARPDRAEATPSDPDLAELAELARKLFHGTT